MTARVIGVFLGVFGLLVALATDNPAAAQSAGPATPGPGLRGLCKPSGSGLGRGALGVNLGAGTGAAFGNKEGCC